MYVSMYVSVNVCMYVCMYNVARLRKYICLRKNIPLPNNTYPFELVNHTVTKLESHLMELN